MRVSAIFVSTLVLLVSQTQAACWSNSCACRSACSATIGADWCIVDESCPGAEYSYAYGWYQYCEEVRCTTPSCCSGNVCGHFDGTTCCPNGGEHHIHCQDNGAWTGTCESYGYVNRQQCATPAPIPLSTSQPTPTPTTKPKPVPTVNPITRQTSNPSLPDGSVTSDTGETVSVGVASFAIGFIMGIWFIPI